VRGVFVWIPTNKNTQKLLFLMTDLYAANEMSGFWPGLRSQVLENSLKNPLPHLPLPGCGPALLVTAPLGQSLLGTISCKPSSSTDKFNGQNPLDIAVKNVLELLRGQNFEN
jgi:hypothetical protein